MRICILTEGQSEYASLPLLFAQLAERSGHTFAGPLKINLCPDATPNMIARQAKSRLLIAARKADLVILLLDREAQLECPGRIAVQLEAALVRHCVNVPIRVVLKDRTYENWLVADLAALRMQPARFKVSRALARSIEPNRSDSIDGERILNEMTKNSYDKVKDSTRICAKMDVGRAASNSRSFRHLLHVVGDMTYTRQCKSPA